jgi:putative ABC transport system permease protein
VLFTVQRKVKEIGVRKVLGAGIRSILSLICRDFALLVVVGFVLAIPVSLYLANQWLSNFVYHTDVGYRAYAVSFLIVSFVVAVTISYQALHAAMANPVASIRTE